MYPAAARVLVLTTPKTDPSSGRSESNRAARAMALSVGRNKKGAPDHQMAAPQLHGPPQSFFFFPYVHDLLLEKKEENKVLSGDGRPFLAF